MIETTNLAFNYDTNWRFDFKDLSIKAGEHVFIFGQSGSGKTTLLHLLSGILPSSQGQIKIANHCISNLSTIQRDRFRRDHLGYVFQQFNLLPYLSIQENIALPLHLSPIKKQKNKHTTHDMIDRIQLHEFSEHQTKNLSQGQKQRVAIARAMMGDPDVILADEPTSALDDANTDICMKLLKQVRSTIILISHDLSLKKYFDRALDMNTILNQPRQT